MARCFYCDFSDDDVDSLYNQGLQLKRSRQNRIIYDKLLEKDICTDCLHSGNLNTDLTGEDAYDAYLEDQEDREDELY